MGGLNPLRVLHVTGSLSRLGGGVAPFVWELTQRLQAAGVACDVAGVHDRWTASDAGDKSVRSIRLARAVGPASFAYAPQLPRRLREAPDVDVIHVHGMWMHFGVAARREAQRRRVPLVISPHGSFEPWRLRQRAWKKWLGRRIFEDRNVHAAACLHATCAEEEANIRAAGFDAPVAVLPIGVDLADYCDRPMREYVDRAWPQLAGKKFLLFASRIHPMKGLMELLDAWRAVAGGFDGWHLVIAGIDQNGYQARVQARAAQLGLTGRTSFVGPIFGEAKRALFASCEAFVLPSHSENFGIVVSEALASGRPVITTVGTPWRQLAEHRCGWWIQTGAEPLAACLRQCLAMSAEELSRMGRRGRLLVERHYAWPQIVRQFADVYEWLLGRRAMPGCVATVPAARAAA